MSKVTFRPKLLDSVRQMPVYVAEVLPDLPEFSAVNRGVPQMPSGMEKEEESEHHLLKAICSGQIIPTPDFVHMNEEEYSQLYPKTYKQPKQLIRLQLAFLLDSDEPEYNADSEDEKWLLSQANKINIDQRKFESIMDKLEKSNYQTVISLNEAKAFIKDDDDIVIAIYDYWLNKRLLKQHSLICSVKTDVKPGISANSPYIAFRKRVEKMQTRKNRKNDEVSYERMLKFQRDLLKALYIIEMVQKRERLKREKLKMSSKLFEQRFAMKDFGGEAICEALRLHQRSTAAAAGSSMAVSGAGRSAFSTLYDQNDNSWSERVLAIKEEASAVSSNSSSNRRSSSSTAAAAAASAAAAAAAYASSFSGSGLGDKRQYKRRKVKNSFSKYTDDDSIFTNHNNNTMLSESEDDENPFLFKRNKYSSYYKPINVTEKTVDAKQKYSLTSISFPNKFFGFGRRRLGRGGRMIFDRVTNSIDDIFQLFDSRIIELNNNHRTEMSPTTSQSGVTSAEPEGQTASASSALPVARPSEQSQTQPAASTALSASISTVPAAASAATTTAAAATALAADTPALATPSPENNSTSSCIPSSVFEQIIDKPSFNIDHFTQDLLLNTQNELEQIENWPCFRPKTPPPLPSGIATQQKQDSQITRALWATESPSTWTSSSPRLSTSMSPSAITADDLQVTVQIENCDRNEKSIFKSAPIDSSCDFSNMLSSDDTGRRTLMATTTATTTAATTTTTTTTATTVAAIPKAVTDLVMVRAATALLSQRPSQSSATTTPKTPTNPKTSESAKVLSSSIRAATPVSITRTGAAAADANTSSKFAGKSVAPSPISKRKSSGSVSSGGSSGGSSRGVQPKQHFLLQQQLQAGPLMSSALKAFTLAHNYNCAIPVNAVAVTASSPSLPSTPSKCISPAAIVPLSSSGPVVATIAGHANRSPTVISGQTAAAAAAAATATTTAASSAATAAQPVLAQQQASQSSQSTAASGQQSQTPPPPPPPPYVSYTTNDHSTYFNHKQMPNHIMNGGGAAVPYTEPKYLNSGVFIK